MLTKYLDDMPTLGNNSWVHDSAVVIGKVALADEVSVWPNTVIRGDVNTITVGNCSNVQDGAVIHATHAGSFNPDGFATQIGECVTIGHNATLHGCTIGDRVLIGMGAIILDDTLIPSDVIIGAGALVPMHKKLDSGYLYLGSPAKAVRPLTPEEQQFLTYSAEHYIKLKNNYTSES